MPKLKKRAAVRQAPKGAVRAAAPAATKTGPEIKQAFFAVGMIFGLSTDNKIYLWDAFTGTFKPNTMDDKEKKDLLTKAATLANNNGANIEPTAARAANGTAENPLS